MSAVVMAQANGPIQLNERLAWVEPDVAAKWPRVRPAREGDVVIGYAMQVATNADQRILISWTDDSWKASS